MASQDMRSDVSAVLAKSLATIASDTTTDGATLDTKTYEAVTFVMAVGTVTAGDVTLNIQDSPTGSSWTNVSDTYLIGLESATTLTATGTVSTIGYVGGQRYVRCQVVTANSANLTVGVVAILGHPRLAPATA